MERDDNAALETSSLLSLLSSHPPVMAVTGIINKEGVGKTEEG